jgi:enterochelin esterase family protein
MAAKGKVETLLFYSGLYGGSRKIWVYTPPGYDASRKPAYDLLLTFDGDIYVDPAYMGIPDELDSLLAAGTAPPFIAVMIDHNTLRDRIAELGNSSKFVKMMGDELVPWIRQRYNVTRDPKHTIVTGSSAGGLGAMYVAFERPELFGNVLAQSGAFWRPQGGTTTPQEWLTAQIASSPRKDISVVMDVGSLETHRVIGGAGPVFIEAVRRLKDALVAKGYSVRYTEVQGGVHNEASWRRQFPRELVSIVSGWN